MGYHLEGNKLNNIKLLFLKCCSVFGLNQQYYPPPLHQTIQMNDLVFCSVTNRL
jgi:hypothetical protein